MLDTFVVYIYKCSSAGLGMTDERMKTDKYIQILESWFLCNRVRC